MTACFKSNHTIEEMQEKYAGPLIEVDSVETWYSDSAQLKIHMTAPKQLELQNGNREFPEGVYVQFYKDSAQKTPSYLKANYGILLKNQNLYKVSGNVIVENPLEKKKLTTEELFWSPHTKKITTKEQVIITTPNEIIQGVGMEAKQDFSSYTINQVTGILHVQ
jgi:LPS export ABC transporter protein LptC